MKRKIPTDEWKERLGFLSGLCGLSIDRQEKENTVRDGQDILQDLLDAPDMKAFSICVCC